VGTHLTIEGVAKGHFVEIAVDDDGPGLPQGREEELFESFARGETRKSRKSAGLGLAISRAIVEAHGGTIRAEPREGRGTRIVFSLPLA
jgi:two-component system sensor histidine kinase KdpD